MANAPYNSYQNSPQSLSLETFVAAVHDVERTQFQVLSGLKKIRQNFHHNKIYPDLSHLIDLHHSLQAIIDNANALQQQQPRALTEINLEERKLIYTDIPLHDEHFEQVRDLINWAMPHILTAIDEGSTIFEFVEENLQLEVVGILPSYLEEGYIFIPDNAHQHLHLLKYDISIFTSTEEKYRSLKTQIIKSVQQSLIQQPAQTLKLELVQEFPELPNPATYAITTDLEFPFQETILPVAKRCLLRHIFS
ncbi:MAG: hypothetical protein EAZ92_12140 [Candidatus Kapaibacterium sp.]|nr:MAG: hypothetical protein EAZ92_12140 [Candidatus Kapabacteria bacterium]